MFENPSAKRVRRDELHSPASSPRSSPDLELTEFLRSRAQNEYAFTELREAPIEADIEEEEEEAELVLFSAKLSTGPQLHKIRLSSPGADTREAGFLVKKPRGYYFTHEHDDHLRTQYEASAIDGKAVLQLSKEPWPGCILPCKVKTITANGIKKAILTGHPESLMMTDEMGHKRKRKGKKSRIALRKKLEATKAKREVAERNAQEKDMAERIKRAQRNREKKLKKRARDKAKKLADVGAAQSVPGAEVEESGSSEAE